MQGSQSEIALRFSKALLEGRYAEAHQLLCRSLRNNLSREQLEEEFLSMVSYDGGSLTEAEDMEGMDDWPEKQPGDIQWCYIAFSGKSALHECYISEAIQVILMHEDDGVFIRTIEWGRP